MRGRHPALRSCTHDWTNVGVVSGEVPEVPVFSANTGDVYEKRLIDRYVSESGTCPVTGQTLSADDLQPIKSKFVLCGCVDWVCWGVCGCV